MTRPASLKLLKKVELLLALIGGLIPFALYKIYFSSWMDFSFSALVFSLLCYAIVLGIGLLTGMELPLLFKVYDEKSEILGFDYLGSFCGALLSPFCFEYLGLHYTALLMAFFNLILFFVVERAK